MANDAGCRFGTDENRKMAAMIEADEYRRACERDEERAAEEAMEAGETAYNSRSTQPEQLSLDGVL